MLDKQSPIGIIDSGIGGYSVARRMQRLLPHEDFLYLGDGANTPYGNHSAQEILHMTRRLLQFMAQRRVKALVVACNTISCVLDRRADEISCPVFSAVQAGAEAAARLEAGKVGVISTVFTHNSRIYPRKIQTLSPRKVVVLSCGCPDLARLVEHSLGDPAGMALVEENLRQELDPMVRVDRVDCCVLGCTHYPLVADSIHRLYPGLPLIDPAEEMARALKRQKDTQQWQEGIGIPHASTWLNQRRWTDKLPEPVRPRELVRPPG